MDQLSTIAAGLERMDAVHAKPRPPPAIPKTRRCRIADRFSSDELAQLVDRYKAGEMSTSLARECNIAKSTFLRLLAEHGVDTRPRGLTPAKETEVRRLRKQGMIIRDIAKRVGCSHDTVRKFLLMDVRLDSK
jgi:DNA-binding NarL/FixJ family response regulator